MAVAAGVVPDAQGAEASLRELLAAALEANRQLSELAERQQAQLAELREVNARLVARDAEREAELAEARAALTVADRLGHANMSYTLTLYTHRSTGKDRNAAENVAGVLLGAGWTCTRCRATYIGTPPASRLCHACEAC